MRDYFSQRMENDRGDLADVVRSGGWIGGASSTSTEIPAINDWHLPSDPSAFFPSDGIDSTSNFGHPFASLYDPLLDELTGIDFFNNNSSSSSSSKNNGGEGDGGIIIPPQKLLMGEEEMRKPRTRRIMPRVFQVASAGSGGIKACPLSPPEAIFVGEMMKVSSGVCSADDGGVQISSARTLGIKRRKNQVKRVVCIPAPAAASSSRPSGEVVPSDLWAWRKYGQKPIKGSPYPRGYYRCSSSKGCSARKQVERSRANPNMLVVTYTSEHNHPWPTQRNALAGSTRPQAATCKNIKNINTASTLRIKSDPPREAEDPPGRKEEETSSGSINNSLVKEEAITAAAGEDDGLAADVNEGGAIHDDDHYTDQQAKMSCRLQEGDDCLFTDLAELELESDPMSLIFSEVLLRSRPAGENAADAPSMFN